MAYVKVSEAEAKPDGETFHSEEPVSKNIPITLACGDYEITRALKEGTVKPDGIDLTVLTDMDSTTRHWRFLRNRDFDMAETSASSYIVARGQDWPVRALPVFLHRRFRHGFVFVNAAKGIEQAHRPDRPPHRHQVVPRHRDPLDARPPGEGIRRAAHRGRMGRRARRGRRLHAAAGPQADAAPPRQIGGDHARRGRARRRDPFEHHQAVRRRRSAGAAGCGRTTSRRRSRSTSAPASSRSCM